MSFLDKLTGKDKKAVAIISRRPQTVEQIERRFAASDRHFSLTDLFSQTNGKPKISVPWEITSDGYISISDSAWEVITAPGDPEETARNVIKRKKKKEALKKNSLVDHELFFRYTKKAAKLLDKAELEKFAEEIKILEEACNKAIKNGQVRLSESYFNEMFLRGRESMAIAKGYDKAVEYEKVGKYFNRIRGGKIALTEYSDFMRMIPDDVMAAKDKAMPFFDGFVIMHCLDLEKLANDKSLTKEDKEVMSTGKRDPILFGVFDGGDRMYFIADWIDDYCDLTWGELAKTLAAAECEEKGGEYGVVKSSVR